MIEFRNSFDGLEVKTPTQDWHDARETYDTINESDIKKIIRTLDRNNSIVENFKGFLEYRGLNNEVKLSNYYDDGCWDVDIDGVMVSWFTDDLGKDIFQVSVQTYDPGGYWEPPSCDYAELDNFSDLNTALFHVLGLLMKFEWESKCQADYEAKLFEEEMEQ